MYQPPNTGMYRFGSSLAAQRAPGQVNIPHVQTADTGHGLGQRSIVRRHVYGRGSFRLVKDPASRRDYCNGLHTVLFSDLTSATSCRPSSPLNPAERPQSRRATSQERCINLESTSNKECAKQLLIKLETERTRDIVQQNSLKAESCLPLVRTWSVSDT